MMRRIMFKTLFLEEEGSIATTLVAGIVFFLISKISACKYVGAFLNFDKILICTCVFAVKVATPLVYT